MIEFEKTDVENGFRASKLAYDGSQPKFEKVNEKVNVDRSTVNDQTGPS